jgi:hypothetical protein
MLTDVTKGPDAIKLEAALKMEAEPSSRTSVTLYKTTWLHISEDSNLPNQNTFTDYLVRRAQEW